jgi:hypothetical protein
MIFANGEHKAFQMFLDGDLRVDGQKSQWLKDFEAYMASKESRKADRPKAVPVAKRVKAEKKPRKSRSGPRQHCPLCARIMNANTYGICWKCTDKYKAFIRQEERKVCDEPGCGTRMRVDCTWTKCRKHSNPLRNKSDWERRKQKLHALKEAA